MLTKKILITLKTDSDIGFDFVDSSVRSSLNYYREEFLDINQHLAEGLSHLNELIHNNQKDGFIDNNQNYKTWTEELDYLRGEVEGLKAAIIDHNNVEWEAPTHSDIFQ